MNFSKLLFCFLFLIFLNWETTSQTAVSPEEAKRRQLELKEQIDLMDRKKEIRQLLLHYSKILELTPYATTNQEFILETYRELGFYFRELEIYEESNLYFKKYLDYYEMYHHVLNQKAYDYFTEQIGINYNMISVNYLMLSKPDSAALWMQKTIALKKQGIKNDLSHAAALNNYGLHLLERSKTDSALLYFYQAKNIGDTLFTDHHLYGSIVDNIADVYNLNQFYHKAANLYEQNFRFYPETFYTKEEPIDYYRWIAAGTQWAEVLISSNDIEKAAKILDSVKVIYNSISPEKGYYIASEILYLKALQKLYIHTNDFRKAYNTAIRVSKLVESLQKSSSEVQREKHAIFRDLILERVQDDLLQEKRQKAALLQRHKLLLLIGFLSIVLVISSFLFFYNRRKQNLLIAKQKARNITLEKAQLEYEFNTKKRELADAILNLTHNMDWAQELLEKLKTIKTTRGRERKKLMETFEKDIKNKVAVDKQTEEFYKQIDTINESFHRKLHKQFPELTKNDIRLCSLIRIKIDSQEIATLQNISLASLNTARYRLRKKLRLDKDDSLDDFIQNI